MKRNSSLSTSLKGYTTYSTPITKSPTIKESSCYNRSSEEYYMNGFPWPPRSYTCSFCRKEFKSAQALGGHMNVHRRDRARLRQSSPTHEAQGRAPLFNLNLNPTTTTTNPNFSTSSPSSSSSSTCAATTLKPVTCTLPLFVSPPPPPPPPPPSASEFNRWVVVDGILLNPLTTNTSETITKSNISGIGDECRMLKKGQMLRMDLEIGLQRDYDLDLELRLGTYS